VVSTAVGIAIVVVFAAILLGRQVRAWWEYRGQRVIVCPDSRAPAGVVVDARHAAVTSLLGTPELRLTACSRWPERGGCGQPCLSQIAAAPEDCLVRSIVARWYEGKTCAFCGQSFGRIEWTAARPALLEANGVSIEWSRVPADRLQEVLAVGRPVCFACHMAGKMVRERPDLVTDRSSNVRSQGS
jgi:hypothetical protein